MTGKNRAFQSLVSLIRSSRIYRWPVYLAFVGLGLALFAGILANDKPIYCKYQGDHYFPIVSGMTVQWGWTTWPEPFFRENWLDLEYEQVIFTLIPYAPTTLDLKNSRYKSPLGKQDVTHWRFRHWLGTDQLGRDVLSGLIHGIRPALIVGFVGTAVALVLGLIFGGIMGFYGDHRLKTGPLTWLGLVLGLGLAIFYGHQTGNWLILSGVHPFGVVTVSLLIGVGVLFLLCFLGIKTDQLLKMPLWKMPVDLILMRVVESIQAMPGMLLLLALIPLFIAPSIWNVVLIIGFIRWPGIARFVRAEMLRIREMPYIESAEGSGVPPFRLLWRHALPNALFPLFVVGAFSVSSGVLLEAFLSFLGLGIANDQVTWGSMLNQARKYFDAWWLVLFPGLALFLTVTTANLLGDALQAWVDRRKPFFPISSKDWIVKSAMNK